MLRNPRYRSACSGASLHTSIFSIRCFAVAAVTDFEDANRGSRSHTLQQRVYNSSRNAQKKPRPEPWLLEPEKVNLLGSAFDLAQTGSLAAQTAQVEELGAADLVAANLLDLVDDLGVVGEDALDALAEAHLANGKGALGSLAAGDHNAFKRLKTLFFAFLDLDLNANLVAGGELREIGPL